MVQRIGAFVLATAVAYVLGSIAASQHVIAQVGALGIDVTLGQRAEWIVHDIFGMSVYLIVIAVTLLVAFLVAAVIIRFVPNLRFVGYVLAGGLGVVLVHQLLALATDGIVPIAATRSGFGLMVQGLAGAVGGYVFVRTLPRPA